MKAEVLSGCKTEQENNYDFFAAKILTEQNNPNRVAVYVAYGREMTNKDARLFVERPPVGMSWLTNVFDLVKDTQALPLVESGLVEIRIDCKDDIEIKETEDSVAIIDHQRDKVYQNQTHRLGEEIELEEFIDSIS